MNKLTWISALLMLTAAGDAHACSGSNDAKCLAAALLAASDHEEYQRYREPDEGDPQGPLSVHVTTFDSSPATPGMWYERPRRHIEDEDSQQQSATSRAPFDRQR